MKKENKRVTVIGGGTGVFTVLTGLKHLPYHLSAILTMADDGGSSGVLREEFGILPPGDIRRALLALAPSSTHNLAKLFNFRFKDGSGLKGHSFGNLLITALERITGRFDLAVKEAAKILNISGEIIPVTLDNTRLFARLENGLLIVGESNIDIPKHNANLKIKEVFLNPPAKINPEARRAILNADLIVLGPGDLYTSLIPNLLIKGVKEAIRKSRGQKVYFCNIMTKYGETNGFKAKDFLMVLEKYLGKNVLDYFVINTQKPKAEYLKKYAKEKKELVLFDSKEFVGYPVFVSKSVKIDKKFLTKPSPRGKTKIIALPLIRRGALLRHDPFRLAGLVQALLS
jgi:uncharacterized cofD-like protein